MNIAKTQTNLTESSSVEEELIHELNALDLALVGGGCAEPSIS